MLKQVSFFIDPNNGGESLRFLYCPVSRDLSKISLLFRDEFDIDAPLLQSRSTSFF